ncbi:hypothetical protein INT48_002782 [Thamnidium elegans]|uniref:Uncharacterized protein n=1 Tax=Thamnidium elegans TaxID=101142 RepID=A0A8H7SFE5_9FUNG|nr:hypothetical protein INT48_002782 [Thamnidium elegans]
MRNDGTSILLDGTKTKKLLTIKGDIIAKVSATTFEKFQMEGTGLLRSGIMVNLDTDINSFIKLDRIITPYGLGTSNGLVPWVSIASNDIKKGSLLYIKELDGLKLPGNKIHNGCVRVDDRGWSLSGCHIDFFVLQFKAYKSLTATIPDNVTIELSKTCIIQDYVTESIKKWAVL